MSASVGDMATAVKGSVKINVPLLPTAPMPPLQPSPVADVSIQQHNRKALFLIRENIRTLLARRGESQTALARYCGHDKSWINKFLNEGRGVQLDDLDKIAAYFGIEPYQLMQPGIARLTERRSGAERRTNTDRRIGHTGRLVNTLQSELNKVPRFAAPSRGGLSIHGVASDPSSAAVNALIREFEGRLNELYTPHPAQADHARGSGAAVASPRDRKPRGPHGPTPKKAAGET
jgi:transcriptional regulator with XRE-family HTH domain